MTNLRLAVDAWDNSARACTFTTLSGTVVKTPVFMPVATVGALRSQNLDDVAALGFPILLANTYHLLLRPGMEVLQKLGGIKNFIQWPASLLTDSGGFQVFSMHSKVKLTEDGALFQSYINGKTFLLSPETSIEYQRIIGGDIMMAMDSCISSTADESLCLEAADITARWAERSLAARADSQQSLFGIIQGACYPRLRKQSAEQICSLPFDGFALGGLAVGETAEERREITGITAPLMPADRPRYLMGVGTPADLLDAVYSGIDMFDCIMPAAMGLQGVAFTYAGKIELRRGVYRFEDKPIDETCACPACSKYSRAYIHHLIKSEEYFGRQLTGLHNLTFYKKLTDDMRGAIIDGRFDKFYSQHRERISECDAEHPPRSTPPKKQKSLPSLGDYQIIKQKNNSGTFYSIRQKSSLEIMHSVTPPLEEANALYVEQANLRQFAADEQTDELHLWDVGLGAGTNAMAAIFKWEELNAGKGLVITSFEKDTNSLRLAAEHPEYFPHTRHSAPKALLAKGLWKRDNVYWQLLKGDFQTTIDLAPQQTLFSTTHFPRKLTASCGLTKPFYP